MHFHEGSQKFCIIPTGVTITEAYDGVSILTSHSFNFLMGIAIGFNLAVKKHGLAYTFADVKAMINRAEVDEMSSGILIKED